jgi:hypothetical protein
VPESDNVYFRQWVAAEVESILGYEPTQDVIEQVEKESPPQHDGEIRPAYVSGVYYLYENGVVLYIGQSRNVYSRIAQHMAGAQFTFDCFAVQPCEPEALLRLEAEAIRRHMPRWNKDIPAHDDKPFAYRGPWT